MKTQACILMGVPGSGKTSVGETLGGQTELSCEVCPDGEGGIAVVDAFPLDAVERKLMCGAGPGVTSTLVTWFVAHLENVLGIPSDK